MKEIKIRPNESGQRLDKFLAKYMKQAPKSFLYKMLRKKNITLNGKKASGNEILAQEDVIRLFLSDETIAKFSGDSKPPEDLAGLSQGLPDIIYEDEHTIFLNKPAGMLSQKASAEDVSLVEYLIGYLIESGQLTREELRTFRPSVCNRLDRNTSGIVAAGKSLAALQQLGQMFRDRSLKKYYLCLVEGVLTKPAEISGYLYKNSKTNQVSIFTEEREQASFIETEYVPLKSSGKVTLLEVHLITGKTHQIRAHLAAKGHPIIGDYKYGNRELNNRYREKYGLTAQLLHAWRLCMPECGGVLQALSGAELMAPVPELFEKICKASGVM